MEVTELFSFIKDFGFPVVLSWFLLVRMENKLAGLTDVISELSCTSRPCGVKRRSGEPTNKKPRQTPWFFYA
ncbi:MAG: YvrJ family protein [Acidaminococcaceae bacterium]|nr:YvrJ family protein [Acidaminococcaceae bacterium]